MATSLPAVGYQFRASLGLDAKGPDVARVSWVWAAVYSCHHLWWQQDTAEQALAASAFIVILLYADCSSAVGHHFRATLEYFATGPDVAHVSCVCAVIIFGGSRTQLIMQQRLLQPHVNHRIPMV